MTECKDPGVVRFVGHLNHFPVKDVGLSTPTEETVVSVLRIGFVEILYCMDGWVILLSQFTFTKLLEQIMIHARPVLNSGLQLRN